MKQKNSNQSLKILVIEDNPVDSLLIEEILSCSKSPQFVLEKKQTLAAGMQCLGKKKFDIILLDLGLPDSCGLGTFLQVHAAAAEIPVIILTVLGDDVCAVEAVQEGAQDYLIKGQLEPSNLMRSIRYAVERKKIELELINAQASLERKVAERTAALEEANRELQEQINERKRIEEELRRHKDHLEVLVKERTAELEKFNLYLQEEIDNSKKLEQERRQAEAQIKASLAEKEVLLKEVHHRVKNNLQVINSLLNLQSKRLKDEDSVSVFVECQNRINSISLVHQKLYESGDLANIDFGQFIQELTRQLFAGYSARMPNVHLQLDVENIILKVNKAIPCALMINELVMNSIKFGFPHGKAGNICVKFKKHGKGKVWLSVEDNGVGLPSGLDVEIPGTLGMQIINALVKQLQGESEFDSCRGTKFVVKFDVE